MGMAFEGIKDYKKPKKDIILEYDKYSGIYEIIQGCEKVNVHDMTNPSSCYMGWDEEYYYKVNEKSIENKKDIVNYDLIKKLVDEHETIYIRTYV